MPIDLSIEGLTKPSYCGVPLAQTGHDKDLPASSANMSESGSDAWTCSAPSWSEISARLHDVATSPHDEVA